jgi:hypothetical protein
MNLHLKKYPPEKYRSTGNFKFSFASRSSLIKNLTFKKINKNEK